MDIKIKNITPLIYYKNLELVLSSKCTSAKSTKNHIYVLQLFKVSFYSFIRKFHRLCLQKVFGNHFIYNLVIQIQLLYTFVSMETNSIVK